MRNLKVLGLALLAVFSMATMMASAAQATPETTTLTGTGGATTAILTAEQQTGGEQVFTVNTGAIKCPSVRIPETTVKLPAETIEVHPEYGQTLKCKAFGFAATITTTGCNYLIHLTTGIQEKITGQVTILCSGANQIKVTNIGTNCVVTVGSQTILTDVVFDNTLDNVEPNKDDLDLTAENLHSIEYTETGTECAKPGVTSKNGTYKGNTTIKGFVDNAENKEGAQVGILID